jgi:hypothetical protein
MRRLLALAAITAAVAAGLSPAPASALCYTEVHGFCVGPCEVANLATRTVTGDDVLYC